MLALDQLFQYVYFIIKLRYLVSELKAKSMQLVIVFLPLILFYFTARIKITIIMHGQAWSIANKVDKPFDP